MHRARTLVLALFVGCLLPAVAAGAETERVHKVVPLGPGGTLKLNNFSGDIRITGSDANQVTIDAIRRGEREQLDNVKLVVEASGDTVSIDANRRNPSWERHDKNVVETEFEIQVPRQAILDIHAFSSAVAISGVSGAQTVKTFSGRVEVADGPGRIRATTFSGPLTLRLGPNASEPQVEVETFSGPIELQLPDATRGRLEFNTFSGDLTSDLPLTLQRQSRRQLVAELGGGGDNRIHLKSFSGDVRLVR